MNLFGIKHFSPISSINLINFLNETKPSIVLIEGFTDISKLLCTTNIKNIKPPFAFLAYKKDLSNISISSDAYNLSLTYPLTVYSPEYQAIIWAFENRAEIKFIDLPSENYIYLKSKLITNHRPNTQNTINSHIYKNNNLNRYNNIENSDKNYFEALWEKYIDINITDFKTYLEITNNLAETINENLKISIEEKAFNEIREAFMRRKIKETLAEGYPSEKIAVIAGIFHIPKLNLNSSVMSDKELSKIPKVGTNIAIIPYSYSNIQENMGLYRESNFPNYQELVWNCLTEKNPDMIPFRYFSLISEEQKKAGNSVSPADIIDSISLSYALASIHERTIPSLSDMRDAALICIGKGEYDNIKESIYNVEIGTKKGKISYIQDTTNKIFIATPLMDDFISQLKKLKLEKYRVENINTLKLDIRENNKVKSNNLKFLDLERSFFLHRCKLLGLNFNKKTDIGNLSSCFEIWELQWSNDINSRLFDISSYGNTIKSAVQNVLIKSINDFTNVSTIGNIIEEVFLCNITDVIPNISERIKDFSYDNFELEDLCLITLKISNSITYGSCRNIDSREFLTLFEKMYSNSVFSLRNNCLSNCIASEEAIKSINILENISLIQKKLIDTDCFYNTLYDISKNHSINPKIAGYSCAVLFEKGFINEDELKNIISHKFSTSISPYTVYSWFEGLFEKNPYFLLSNIKFWEIIDSFISSLEEEKFKKAVVYLRKIFSKYSKKDKQKIVENLIHIWKPDNKQLEKYNFEDIINSTQNINNFDFSNIV